MVLASRGLALTDPTLSPSGYPYCRNGHEKTPENTKFRKARDGPGTTGICLICYRESCANAAKRRRALARLSPAERLRLKRGRQQEQQELDPRVLTCRTELEAHKKRVAERDAEKLAEFQRRMEEIRNMPETALRRLSYMRPKNVYDLRGVDYL